MTIEIVYSVSSLVYSSANQAVSTYISRESQRDPVVSIEVHFVPEISATSEIPESLKKKLSNLWNATRYFAT